LKELACVLSWQGKSGEALVCYARIININPYGSSYAYKNIKQTLKTSAASKEQLREAEALISAVPS
jgi:hypothetical protein